MTAEPNDSSAGTLGVGVTFQEFVLQMYVPPPGEEPVRLGRPPRPAPESPDRPADRDTPPE